MVNYIGSMPDRDRILALPGAHHHDYGKAPRGRPQARPLHGGRADGGTARRRAAQGVAHRAALKACGRSIGPAETVTERYV